MPGNGRETSQADPIAAFARATTVGRESNRRSLTRRAVDELKKAGRADTALREINASELSDKKKEYLLKRL